jgi:hypothetical protein
VFELIQKIRNNQATLACEVPVQVLDKMLSKLNYGLEFFKEKMLVCYYCGKALSRANCNSECLSNKDNFQNWFRPFHNRMPDEGWHGSRCHWFAKPGFFNTPLKYLEIVDGHNWLIVNESFESGLVGFVL